MTLSSKVPKKTEEKKKGKDADGQSRVGQSKENEGKEKDEDVDWQSKRNLIAALEGQTNHENEVFDSIEKVDLKVMFGGLERIRVHKYIRPINYRRETQIVFNCFAEPSS